MAEFADNGPSELKLVDGLERKERTSIKRKKNIRLARKKRLKRNRNKRNEMKSLSKQERRNRIHKKIGKQFEDQLNGLKVDLLQSQHIYEKERRISDYCWYKWKKEHRLHRIQSSVALKRICRQNLKEENKSHVLGKGSFGTCFKMQYRGINVAVKHFENSVSISSVLHEASLLNQFDHPGLPLLFGICLSGSPLLMVTQFHGVGGACVTLSHAHKLGLLKEHQEWARIFLESAQALQYVHNKQLIHNDIKGDNVIISKDTHFHPIIIDFGKCRKMEDAKLYQLSKKEQKIYKLRHHHIAPELIRGTHRQSYASDVFSFGAMLKSITICNVRIDSISKQCISECPSERPSLTVVCKQLSMK